MYTLYAAFTNQLQSWIWQVVANIIMPHVAESVAINSKYVFYASRRTIVFKLYFLSVERATIFRWTWL